MSFLPMELVLKRVRTFGDTDSALFNELLLAGEFIVKATVAGFISSIDDDIEGHRYRLLHALVRADGIGEWASKLDDVLTGPASQHLCEALKSDRRLFTERVGSGDWQYDAVVLLHEVLTNFTNPTPIGDKTSLRAWFTKFGEVRNKTRGHGAITPAACARLVPMLERSISLVARHNPIFQRPWAYLHENLSGKYKVVKLGGESPIFAELSKSSNEHRHYNDGVYLFSDRPRLVELLHSDLDASDFFLPNGHFTGKTFELHSLITDNRSAGDATPYLSVAGERPPSETAGAPAFNIIGNVFTNLPPAPTGYISRPHLEEDIFEKLTNERHPIVTLVGIGGIGKTSSILSVLHKIAATKRFEMIVWFSSRDVDLTASGPKVVQPNVLAEREIAAEFVTLIGALELEVPEKSDRVAFLAQHMRKSPMGPTLFVFDNFETVRSPVDLFQWIDTHIRLPNKVAITSRFREFKADYPIEVFGMERDEADSLMSQTAASLGIEEIIHAKERDQIFEESNGHPYVIKIILGEIANDGKFGKPINIVARKDDILDALFERTFVSLSPLAVRIFLMLSGWRSLVPQIAVEAILARQGSDFGDPVRAIEELVRMSLVERIRSEDGSEFLGVPLTAAIFGNKKLEVSSQRQIIEDEIRFLQGLGATNQVGTKAGVGPRIRSLIRSLAKRINKDKEALDAERPVLEFLARNYPPAWLLLADLHDEVAGDVETGVAAEYVRRFLETKPPEDQALAAWERLLLIYKSANDVVGGCSAFLRLAELSNPPLHQVSQMANWLNGDSSIIEQMDVIERAALFGPLATLMEQNIKEASATDLSRLAWLYLHAGKNARAIEVADLGLDRDPENSYCQKLVEKLRK